LFEAVEGLLKEADWVRNIGINETRWRKAFLTSSWWIGQERDTAMLKTDLMVIGLMTRLNVLSSWWIGQEWDTAMDFKTLFLQDGHGERHFWHPVDELAKNEILQCSKPTW
jgi:hypothetical protein